MVARVGFERPEIETIEAVSREIVPCVGSHPGLTVAQDPHTSDTRQNSAAELLDELRALEDRTQAVRDALQNTNVRVAKRDA